jgi:hypothetical protein
MLKIIKNQFKKIIILNKMKKIKIIKMILTKIKTKTK